MSCEDIIRALRCISTPGGEHEDCTGCPYYKQERLSAELQELADLIDAATRAAEQDQEDAEILCSQPHIDRETVGMLLETRKRLLTLAAWMQHLWEEAEDE